MPLKYDAEKGEFVKVAEKPRKPISAEDMESFYRSVKGEKGDKGDRGDPGKDGIGIKGDPGKDGGDGRNGKDGRDGVDGKDGVDGRDGKDGISPMLRKGETHIEVYDGKNWAQLIPIQDISGKDGIDGRTIEFSSNATHVLWKYTDQKGWNDLFVIPKGRSNSKAFVGVTGIAQSTDVQLTALQDGEILVWDSATRKWINSPAPVTEVKWGDITGDINDQTDLINYIDSVAAPAGNNTWVQFNDGGVFGADGDFTWNKTTNVLNVTGFLGLADPLANIVIGEATAYPRPYATIDICTERAFGLTPYPQSIYDICIGAASYTKASGFAACAIGYGNSNIGGAAVGYSNTDSGTGFFVGNNNNNAGTGTAYVIGTNTTVNGVSGMVSVGSSHFINGTQSTGVGGLITIQAAQVTAVGFQVTAYQQGNTVIGYQNDLTGTTAMSVGRGLKNLFNNTTYMGRVVSNSAELTLQSGRLGVKCETPQSELHVTGDITAASVTSLGAELVTNPNFTGSATGWALGTGWSYSSNQANKGAAGTGTLSQTIASTANKMYQVQFDITLVTGQTQGGTFTVSFGGATSETINLVSSMTKTQVVYLKSTGTGNLIFTPDSASRFGIDNVSVKEVLSGDVNVYGAIKMRQGTDGNIGQVSLTAGVATITINGLTSADVAIPNLITPAGTRGTGYKAVCSTNTLTITSLTGTGNTTQTLDTSTMGYVVFRTL